MDRRFLTVLGVSLVFALVVASVFYQMSARLKGKPRKAENTKTVDMVVAAAALPVGVTIKPADIKVMKVASERLPKGAFERMDDVLGRPVISNILAEEAVVEGRLAQRGSGVGLAPVIPVGMRAVSVKVNEVVGVAGFVLPGMRVDVLVTVKRPGDAGARTTTVLQNILVLSAGQNIQSDGRGQAVNVPVVTLMVAPEQAEILTLAGNEGRLHLVLRNGADKNIRQTAGHEINELYGRITAPPAAKAASRRPVTRKPAKPVPVVAAAVQPVRDNGEVLVIRGTKKSLEVLGETSSN
jgi:pilus assembly protein CpaB